MPTIESWSVNGRGTGRLAGAVLGEGMGYVHLSIFEHSVIFPLHRTGHSLFSFSSTSQSPLPPFCSSLFFNVIYLLLPVCL